MKIILASRCSWTLYNFRAGLMRKLKMSGHVVIGGGGKSDGYYRKIEKLGISFIPLPVDKKPIQPISDLKLFFTLYKWYCKEKPDIVHHFTIKPVIYGSIAAFLAGVPKIFNTVTGLGYVFADGSSTTLKLIVQLLYRFSLCCSNLTFFLNRDDLYYFLNKRLVRYEKVDLLPGEGIDCDYFSNRDQTREKHKHFITFLISCRLIKEKGISEFVEASRIVKKNYPDTRFQIVGERDERNPSVIGQAELERWVSEGIVSWLGSVSDVRPIIADADVVVLPSYYREGIPRSLLEGAAMGKALITTDSVGCRDTVEEGITGLLIPPKDPDALAKAMIKLIEYPDMRIRMGLAGHKKVQLEFDEKLVIRKILKAYNA